MVTQGNHEIEGIPNIVESFKSYNTRWQMPFKESGSDSNLYYSFEVSGVHVLMLGSYTDFSRQSNQYKWLLVCFMVKPYYTHLYMCKCIVVCLLNCFLCVFRQTWLM